MTTTAFDDQFTTGTQTIETVRQPYDTASILRRNIADAKKEMQRQAERAESYADAMRSLASYVGAGGYNADVVDADVFEAKIRWGIGEIMARLEKAESELAKLAQQSPIKYLYRVIDCFGHDVLRDDPKGATILESIPLYAAPVTTPHKGATHCDDCGLTWLDDGLNPLGCPYCKDTVPAPAVPNDIIPEGDDFNGTTPHLIQCIESLVRLDAKGVLVPHGIGHDASKLLTAAANRLRQQAPAVPAVPAVPDEWKRAVADFLSSHDAAWAELFKSLPANVRSVSVSEHQADAVRAANMLRALLQSAEVKS